MVILLLLMANFVYILAEKKDDNIDLMPNDIICPFCIALIEKFQQTTQQNSDYKNVSSFNFSFQFFNFAEKKNSSRR